MVDFGCGGGIDVILASHKVGREGKVVGVDFAPHMIAGAKKAVAEAGLNDRSIEFVLGDIEDLDLPDEFADVVISNCVITLCPNKEAVYGEAFRILKPGGRLAISDLVLEDKIDPARKKRLEEVWQGGLGGAIPEKAYLEAVRAAGFCNIVMVVRNVLTPEEVGAVACCPDKEFADSPSRGDLEYLQGKVLSIKFTAVRPEKKD